MGERSAFKGGVETGVGAILSASHYDENGGLHGHTYEIVAWHRDRGGDAINHQRQLVRVLKELDHKVLPPSLARAEALAEHIRRNTDAVEVEVRRPLERLYARAR